MADREAVALVNRVLPYCSKCGKELPAGAAFCPSCGARVSESGVAVQQPVSGFDTVIKEKRAQDYWVRRLVSFVVDAVIVYASLGIMTVAFAVPLFFFSGYATVISLFSSVFSFVSGILLVFYFAASETLSGASPGKHLFGLRVKGTAGRTPTFAEALVRNVSKIYWVLLLLDVVVGLATSKGYTQKLSDRYIGTDVV